MERYRKGDRGTERIAARSAGAGESAVTFESARFVADADVRAKNTRNAVCSEDHLDLLGRGLGKRIAA